MDKIIATVIILVIVLGLIAFAIIPQQEGIKQAGEKGTTEQQKVLQMVNDPNVVTGATIRSYQAQKIPVTIDGSAPSADTLKDSQVYEMKKTYDSSGAVTQVEFKTINMGKEETGK